MIVPIKILICNNPDEKKLAVNNFAKRAMLSEYSFVIKRKLILSLYKAINRHKTWIRPAIITLQDKNVKKSAFVLAAVIKEIINIIFNIIGSAADNANLLWEFKIEDKIDETLIKIRNGKIILETFTSSVNLSLSFAKPGAIIEIK